MSKGTVRYPESAIAGGRVGTARVSGVIAGAAARLADPSPLALDSTMRSLVASDFAGTLTVSVSTVPSPIERMQQLGRMPTGRRNKTEAAYEGSQLVPRLNAGEILWYRFEGHKLRLADNTFYTPDFAVIVASGELEFHEVKGRWTDKARAKTKVAAAQYPHRFIVVQRAGRHGWRIEDLTSKNW